MPSRRLLPPRRRADSPETGTFVWWVVMEVCTRWGLCYCLECHARKESHQTVCWPSLHLSLLIGPGVSISVDYFGPLVVTARRSSCILFSIVRFSRGAEMYAVNAAEFTTEDTADVLVNQYIRRWGCLVSLFSDTGSKSVRAACASSARPFGGTKRYHELPPPLRQRWCRARQLHNGPNARSGRK